MREHWAEARVRVVLPSYPAGRTVLAVRAVPIEQCEVDIVVVQVMCLASLTYRQPQPRAQGWCLAPVQPTKGVV